MDLVTLADPRQALPHYDAVFLLTDRAAGDVRLVTVLRPLIGAISIAQMREANWLVDRDKDKLHPQDAARRLAVQIASETARKAGGSSH